MSSNKNPLFFFQSKVLLVDLRKLILILIFVSMAFFSKAFGQEGEKASLIRNFNGTITATNNGISLIPAFNLGRPAVFFDLSVGGERLSFDPMFRFAMDGKPWSFIFWWRYKIIKDKRFTLTAGAHPAFIFAEREVIVNGKSEKMLVAQRFLAAEIAPNFKVSNRTSVGLYYLRGKGFNPIPPYNTHFLAFNLGFNDLPISDQVRFRVNSQFFYLKVDDTDGTYFNSSLTIYHKGFPVSAQGFFNQKINSTVPGDDLVWNVSLLYNFANQYTKK